MRLLKRCETVYSCIRGLSETIWMHLMDSSKKTVQTVVKVGADGLLSVLL